MIPPKAVVFDLGKVLLDFDYRIAARKLAPRSGMEVEAFTNTVLRTDLLLRYETGLSTTEEFFRDLCMATGFRGDLSEFALCFADIFTPIEPMIALQAKLRQRGYPSYIFSNTNELAVHHIRKTYPFFDKFDGYVFSFEHRCMKPNRGLYEQMEKCSGCSGAEILYLDDRPENVEAGSARGWQVILHQTPEETLARIRALGMLG